MAQCQTEPRSSRGALEGAPITRPPKDHWFLGRGVSPKRFVRLFRLTPAVGSFETPSQVLQYLRGWMTQRILASIRRYFSSYLLSLGLIFICRSELGGNEGSEVRASARVSLRLALTGGERGRGGSRGTHEPVINT